MIKRILCLTAILFCLLRPACAEVFLNQTPPDNWYQRPLLRLTAFDAAQSDCLLLECGGEAMMVDGGSAPYREKLRDAIYEKGLQGFKYLLNTHFHEDHISGLYWLMRYGLPVGEYLHPYTEEGVNTSSLQRDAIGQTEHKNIPARQVFHGDTLMLGEAVITLWRYEEGISTNGRSLMVHVQFGDATLMLPADIIGDTQSWAVENLPADMLDTDIIKAPHHGITAMVPAYLEAVSPEVILMTNLRSRVDKGENQARMYGIPSLYTGDGRIVLETDGDDWFIFQSENVF